MELGSSFFPTPFFSFWGSYGGAGTHLEESSDNNDENADNDIVRVGVQ
jgi:hypothetical protein